MADLTHLRRMTVARHAQQLAPRGLPPAPAPQHVPAPAPHMVTPAQRALPMTPAAQAMLASMPEGAPPGANTPPREEQHASSMMMQPQPQPQPQPQQTRAPLLAPSQMQQQTRAPLLAPSQMLTPAAIAASAPPPSSVAHAMQIIASSAPSAQHGGGAGRRFTQRGQEPKYANAPSGGHAAISHPHQTRQQPAHQRGHVMSKGFSRTERRIYCPINSAGTVAAAGSQTITQRPQVNFQPDQLIVSPAIGAFFTINSWSVGIQPQQAAGGGVTGDMFPAQNGPHFQFDVCDTGTDLIFNVTNNDAAVHAFSAMLVGYQVEING